MSVESLGEPIAGTANLYAWGEGQVLKLHGEDAPADWLAYVGRVDRALYDAGLPVPAVGDLIEIDGRLGQVYERVEGSTVADELLGTAGTDPDVAARLGCVFAEAHAEVHGCAGIPELPSTRQLLPSVVERLTELPSDLKEATLAAFDEMPEGDRLCHGDYHPYNVLLSPRGPIVIDWNNAHTGNPLEDAARSELILSGFAASQPSFRTLIDQFSRAYLERYFELRPGDRDELAAWRPIVAAVRLADGIPELEDWLLEQVRAGLSGRTLVSNCRAHP